jgi:hypothetical protein
MIFRSISLFLSFGFAYFHLFIYILLYLTHKKKNRREIRSPHCLRLLWLHCDSTATAFPLRLHLTPHTTASSYRPSTHYHIFYRISITSHRAPRIVALCIEAVYRKGLPRPRIFYIDLSLVFVLIIFRSYRHCGCINGGLLDLGTFSGPQEYFEWSGGWCGHVCFDKLRWEAEAYQWVHIPHLMCSYS